MLTESGVGEHCKRRQVQYGLYQPSPEETTESAEFPHLASLL